MDPTVLSAASRLSGRSFEGFSEATQAVLEMLERQLPESAVFVAHLDHDQQLWRLVDARGAGSFTAAPGMTLPADESLCFHMATDRAPRLCNDAAADPVYGRLAMRAHENIGSYLGIPLELSDGSRPGSLCAIAHEPGRYVSDDLELLALMARIVAYELERERRERDLAAVARVARELVDHAEPRSALCKAVIELSDAAFAVLWEPRPGGVLRLSAQAGVELPNVEQAIDGPGGTPEVLKSGQRLFLSDARGNPLARQRLVRAAGAVSLLFEPVVHHGQVLGVVVVGWRHRLAGATSRLVSIASLLTTEAAVAMQQADLVADLRESAGTDALTGLGNLRAWRETLLSELARAERHGVPVCVALVDLDGFKAFNDAHGHPAGDALLKKASTAWRGRLRHGDFAFRYGGDEFVLLLPGTDLDDADPLVERVRAATPDGETASAGVACWDRRESPQSLVNRADRALYEAKDAGRDRTAVAPTPGP